MAIIRENLSDELAKSYGLVLASAGIAHTVLRGFDGWELHVEDENLVDAEIQIQAYMSENLSEEPRDDVAKAPAPMDFSAVWAILLLVTVHWAAAWWGNAKQLSQALGASATHILTGELFRSLTALLLHADSPHLLANIVGLALFGTAVCSTTGSGLGWLLISATGVLGNLANACFYRTGHLSIGASTAVFGAIGILVGLAWMRKGHQGRKRLQWLLPVGGGLGLLAFLGMAPHSDLTAHGFGFLAGMLVGLAYAKWIGSKPQPLYQRLWSGITVLLFAMAWFWGTWMAESS
jgi:membrane associated rhomboid family serine protease